MDYYTTDLNIKKTAFCVTIIIFYNSFQFGLTTPDFMRAIVIKKFGRGDVLTVEQIEVPSPSPDEVLVKVEAAGINPIDVYMRTGTVPIKSPLPIVLGKEVAGYIEKPDQHQKLFNRGDRVFCGVSMGGYAEYAKTGSSYCFPLSEKISFSKGAALFVAYFTCYRALILRGNIRNGDLILIHGASGSIGSAAVQVAKQCGAYVVATVGSHPFEKIMKQSGADYVTYHSPQENLSASLAEFNRTGFDLILEIAGTFDVEKDKKFLSPGGKILIMGNRFFDERPNQGSQSGDELVNYISFFGYTLAELKGAGHFVLEGVQSGKINPIVSREYQFEDAQRAHYDVFYSKAPKGKLVFLP